MKRAVLIVALTLAGCGSQGVAPIPTPRPIASSSGPAVFESPLPRFASASSAGATVYFTTLTQASLQALLLLNNADWHVVQLPDIPTLSTIVCVARPQSGDIGVWVMRGDPTESARQFCAQLTG